MLLCVHQLVANCVCRLFGAEQASRLWVFSAFLLKTAASENDFMTLHTWKSEPRFALMSLWSSLFCFLIEITWVDYRARVLKSLRTVLELGHPATIDDLFVDEHRRLWGGHDVSSVQFLSFSSRVLISCHTECLLLWLTSCNLKVQIINGWNHGFYSNRLNRRFPFLFCFFFLHTIHLPLERSDWFLSLILRATGQKADDKGWTDHTGSCQGHLSMFPTTADAFGPALSFTRTV